ncbi:succinyl-diaminopimelate desuccinylase [Enterobacteriaceae endosymbiont of Neohaemonia nigricornis]|uniref:succinyl-diaminopimelate desuccinylase n=1 Tax=Enterobacteriaceae endosymbiont of Neohaemonia nigricornis TaxID=2675792 RepID=UPI0014499815|nr:succinyl-diaminopimelate desuccinylase [Enterobacteriaceae endosymbiont of Neohaemonia nigricornis]QJC30405.1 succinyl-diaminopimelate desuccinylase [Enterobacteriaceae endosymbiont of Neohaemonia nigricornis]
MLKEIISFTQKIIQCPSISPNDAGCQTLLIKFLKQLGFFIDIININNTKNFWAYHSCNYIKNITPTLVFAGHTDVVTPGNITSWKYHPFKATINNNILYGRGACDMKGALAAMIFAAKLFILTNKVYHGKIAFLITSDEEGTAEDGTIKVIKKLISQKEIIDYCILGEPTSYKIIGDNIKNGRRGSLNIFLKINGVQGHVAYHKLAINPIHITIPFLQELLNIIWEKNNLFLPNTSMQITNIISAIQNNTNIIPNNINIQINFRYTHNIHYSYIIDKINNIIKKYITTYDLDWFLSGKPFISTYNDINHYNKRNLVNIVKHNIKLINKITPSLINDGGTSDGRFIIKTKAQIVELGLKNSTIHKINECVNINDIYVLYKIYYNIIQDILL